VQASTSDRDRLRHIKALLLELSGFMQQEESAVSAELGAELDSNELMVPQHLEVGRLQGHCSKALLCPPPSSGHNRT